jgi:hypothetical protein
MLKKLITALVVGLIALPILSLSAKNIPLISKEISIPRSGSRTFGFGTVSQRGTTVLLEVSSRLNNRNLGGSTAIMTIFVNGKEVKVSKNRHAIRLVNKPLISPVAANTPASWFADARAWRVIYAPDFKGGLKQSFYKGDPYTLVLDITDLIDPTAENRLKLVNLVTNSARWRGLKSNAGELVVQRLNIRTKRGASPMMLPSVDIKPIINRGQAAVGSAEYSGKIMPGGGFAITVGKRQWNFASAFSYPNAGLNYLLPSGKAKGQVGWKVRVKLRKDGGDIFARSPHYKLHRSIRFTARKVEVKDKLTNRNSRLALGLMVRHEVNLKGLKVPVIRLAGNPDPAVNKYHSGMNPSVHISLPDQSIGLLCEDDVFRNQVKLFCKSSTAGICTEMLRLGPGKTYCLEWSVYPVAGPDYFDFINLVRKDWGANFTLNGPYTLFNPEWILAKPIEKLREMFAHHGIKYAISNGSWRIGNRTKNQRNAFGTGVFENIWADHRRKLREAAARIRKAAPQVKIMTYFDSRRDSAKGCHERFRDSWWTNSKGKQLFTTWGAPGTNNLCYTFIPMLNNSFGKAMLASVDRYISETDSDSIYWDEMGGGGGFGKIGITYNMFDGNSCLLDLKRYTIKREVGIPSLLINSYLLAVSKLLHDQGRPLLGNGGADTRSLLASKVPRMLEIQHNDFWCYESNLGSPLGWTYPCGFSFKGTIRTIGLGCLPLGVPLGAKHEISRYLFPFTPIELHHGYLLGKERAIVLHDGNYGWVGKTCLVQLRHFNSKGILINDDSPTLIGKEARTAVKLAKGEAMVLVRTPLEFNPTAGTAKASKLSYEKNVISLQLDAPQGGVLKINSEKFLLKNGTTVKVSLANKAQSLKVENNSLHINIPAKFNANISIKQ